MTMATQLLQAFLVVKCCLMASLVTSLAGDTLTVRTYSQTCNPFLDKDNSSAPSSFSPIFPQCGAPHLQFFKWLPYLWQNILSALSLSGGVVWLGIQWSVQEEMGSCLDVRCFFFFLHYLLYSRDCTLSIIQQGLSIEYHCF